MALLFKKSDTETRISLTLCEVTSTFTGLVLTFKTKDATRTYNLGSDISLHPDRANRYIVNHTGFIDQYDSTAVGEFTVTAGNKVIEKGVFKIVES